MTSRAYKGRGAASAPQGRFDERPVILDDEEAAARAADVPATVVRGMRAASIISSNSSPDVPFDRSINPYLGCEHGCIYCYARPGHSYLDLSPGLDFETRIFYKNNAPEKLLEEWEKPGYVCKPITIGANTDPYQPAEKTLEITRRLLELFLEHRHPVNLITKSHLVTRDLDLLAEMAEQNLCSVAISLPTLDNELKRVMEPRVPSATARLKALELLASYDIPTSVLMAPLIPAINDHEIEAVLDAVANAGARQAHYIFLRLPHELKELFVEWLQLHFPDRAKRVMSLVREAGGGKVYEARFGRRQTGRGAYAELLGRRFRSSCRRLGLEASEYQQSLDCTLFLRPGQQQLGLDF